MILSGESSVSINIDLQILPLYKYAPITSVEVERSFSVLKNVLSDRRHNLRVENLKKVSCYYVQSMMFVNDWQKVFVKVILCVECGTGTVL